MDLTDVQIDALLQPIAGARVSQKQGMSHLESYDVRRRLTNIFGFGGWSGDVVENVLLYEDIADDGKRVSVGYRVTYRLAIHSGDMATYTEVAAGDATNFPINKRGDAHDFAVKTAESQALKRCAINLGDQFGLSLYNKGSLAPLVVYVLGDRPAKWTADGIVRPRKDEPAATVDHVTEQLAPETPAAGDGSPPQDNAPEGASTLPARAKDAHDAPTADAVGPGVPAPPQDSLPLGGGEALPTVQDMLNDEVATVLAGDLPSQKKRGALTKILLRASEARVEDALVYDGNGDAVSLKARIAAAVIQAGR